MADEEIQRSLGRIEGKLDGLTDLPDRLEKLDAKLNTRIDSIDERLRKVEMKSAGTAAVTAGFVAIGIEFIKAKFIGGGH